jgi:hypothetical protein
MKRYALVLLVGGVYMLSAVQLAAWTLTYAAGVGGKLTGKSPQTVAQGAAGTAVKAVPNAGYRFVQWSDTSVLNPRTDINVSADIAVTAEFEVNVVTTLVVLKGTATDTVHYVLNGPFTDAQRDAYGVDDMTLATKPKAYYFMVVEATYTPEMNAAGKWTGEGSLNTWSDLWPMGVVEYGVGRHDANGVWQPKLAYAYDVGAAVDFGAYTWWWPKAKNRAGDGSIYSFDANNIFQDQREGTATLTYSAKAYTDKVTGDSWYLPTITNLTIYYSQYMQQNFGTAADPVWRDIQFGAGKVAFKQDTAMTKIVNDVAGAHVGLDNTAIAIRDFLIKGKYPGITPNLDPDGYYP